MKNTIDTVKDRTIVSFLLRQNYILLERESILNLIKNISNAQNKY